MQEPQQIQVDRNASLLKPFFVLTSTATRSSGEM